MTRRRRWLSPCAYRLVVNGVDVGVALVHQGASRSVMRRSAFDRVKHRMSIHSQLIPVRDMYVVGSTNEYVPIVAAFAADLYTQHARSAHQQDVDICG